MINLAKDSIKSLKTIEKQILRRRFSLSEDASLFGCDVWTAFELSWLNSLGKPEVAVAEFIIPPTSKFIDPKSLKTYLNSFNMVQFDTVESIKERIKQDISLCMGMPIKVNFLTKNEFEKRPIQPWASTNLDIQELSAIEYCLKPILAVSEKNTIPQSFCSDLLRFICFHTGKPIFGSICISLTAKELDPTSLLQYIISYRNSIFPSEVLIEKIFHDIQQVAIPETLSIEIRLGRQGGICISFFRSSANYNYQINEILARQ